MYIYGPEAWTACLSESSVRLVGGGGGLIGLVTTVVVFVVWLCSAMLHLSRVCPNNSIIVA